MTRKTRSVRNPYDFPGSQEAMYIPSSHSVPTHCTIVGPVAEDHMVPVVFSAQAKLSGGEWVPSGFEIWVRRDMVCPLGPVAIGLLSAEFLSWEEIARLAAMR